MAFCTKCGRQRADAARFCTGCGASHPAGPPAQADGPADQPEKTQLVEPTDLVEPTEVAQPAALSLTKPQATAADVTEGPPATSAVSLHPPTMAVDGYQATQAAQAPVHQETQAVQAPVHQPALWNSPELTTGWPGIGDAAASGDQVVLPSPSRRDRAGSRNLLVIIAVVVILAGGGTAGWLIYRQHATGTASPRGQSATRGTTGAPSPSLSTQPPSPTPSPTPGPSTSAPSGLVTVAAGIPADAQTARVLTFVDNYFTAINEHSYGQYTALLNPVLLARETRSSFHQGFRTTADSDATVTAITNDGAGVIGATLTFTSHQAPRDSATGTACTSWNITLFLRSYSGQYLEVPELPGYHAAFSAC